jgi:hypothetical protein
MEAVLGDLGLRDSMEEEGRACAVRVNTDAPTLSGISCFGFRELLPTCIPGWRVGYSIVEKLCPEGGELLRVSAINVDLHPSAHVAYSVSFTLVRPHYLNSSRSSLTRYDPGVE